MTWPSNDYYVRQHMNDYFARNMTSQYFKDQENRNRALRGREYYYDSDSSTHTENRSPDTWVSLALEKRMAERNEKLYRSLNESSSFSFTKFISWFTKK